MKKLSVILLILISCLSCSRSFYQLYKTASLDIGAEDGLYSYNNGDLIIGYNLWDDGGNGSFIVANNTDDEVFIDFGRSHMVVNGLAISYFNNLMLSRTNFSQLTVSNATTQAFNSTYILGSNISSNTSANSLGSTVSTSTENTTTQMEKRVASIPPNSYLVVSGYHINQSELTSCDLVRFPSKKKIKTLNYERADSPIVVRNFLVYSNSESFDEFKTIDNEFWVTEITNYPSEEFFSTRNITVCDKDREVTFAQYSSPSNFYVKITEMF